MKENYHIVWWNEMKTLLLQKKQLHYATASSKKQDMKSYASFDYFYFYFARNCEAGSCV